MKRFCTKIAIIVTSCLASFTLYADDIYDNFSNEFKAYLESKHIGHYEETNNLLEQAYDIVLKNYVLVLSDADKEKMLNNVLVESKRILEQESGQNLTKEDFTEFVMASLLNGLDSHSIWLNKEATNAFNSQLDGSYKGIGVAINVDKETENIMVAQVYSGSSADLAGIKAGDIILKVNGINVEKGSTDQVAALIRGKKGTYVRLVVERMFHNGEKTTNTYEVKRDIVNLVSSSISFINDDILYVDIDYFNRPVLTQFNEFIENNKKPYKAVIFDLRDNPGGLFYETIQILNSIIDDSVVVSVKIPGEESPVSYVSRTGRAFNKETQIIVLVNELTASSAEIFAGAMQDNGIAVIMGENTYGKGSIQTIFDLKDNSALKITTELFYTPEQYSIQNQGVVPDIAVVNTRLQIKDKALKESNSVLDKEFRKTNVKTSSRLDIDDCSSYKGDSFLGCAIDYLSRDS